jgi:SUR7/PalI family
MGTLSLILIAGAIVLQFFVVLSGVTNTSPLNKTYFLQADTSTIAGSGRAVSQWTYFYVCGAGNQDCGSPVPALPFGYAWVGGSAGAPEALIGYVSRNSISDVYADMIQFSR